VSPAFTNTFNAFQWWGRRENPVTFFAVITLGVTPGYLPSVLANLVSSRLKTRHALALEEWAGVEPEKCYFLEQLLSASVA
jgi:hypothetical protein